MRIRMKVSVSGPSMHLVPGREYEVGVEVTETDAGRFLERGYAVPVRDGEAPELAVTGNYPKHSGGGMYRLSNGQKIRGKVAAEEAEKAIRGG